MLKNIINRFLKHRYYQFKLTCSVAFITLASSTLVPPESAQAGIITNGLIGCWTADNNAYDSSSIGNNGSFLGSYVSGVNGQAFDLASAKVYIPDNPAYTFGSSLSIGFWFNFNGTSKTDVAFLGQDHGGGNQTKWFIDYNYHVHPTCFELILYSPSSGAAFLSSNSVTLSDGWNQLTLVKNNNNYSFYLNGIGIGSQTWAGLFPDPSCNLIFGSAEDFTYNGLMDEVVMYNRALTESEVRVLANIPEPATMSLLALAGLAMLRRRRK